MQTKWRVNRDGNLKKRTKHFLVLMNTMNEVKTEIECIKHRMDQAEEIVWIKFWSKGTRFCLQDEYVPDI